MAYASGKYSLAICDRCGLRYKYTQLRKEWNNLFVCPECYEPKAPHINPVPNVADPEAIRDPRPQAPPSIVAGEGVVRTIDANSMMTITGDSIGSAFSSSSATGEVGTVTVVIS